MKDEILFLYLNNELDAKEQKEVEEWINRNPEQFHEIKIIWKKTELNISTNEADLQKVWGNVISKIDQSNNTRERKLPIDKAILKYAAIFILALGLLGIIANNKINHNELIEYTSALNKTNSFVLPDGSSISLNKASSLEYKKQFLAKNREVNLKGEAFFQVKRNPKKPFIINVNGTRVKVLGTSFNIDAADTSGKVKVSVKSGKVMFYDKKDTSNVVYLTKGDVGIFSSHYQKIEKAKNKNQNYLAWKTGILLFKNNTLSEVCAILGKQYNTTLILENPVLAAKKLTARYQDKSLQEVLELMKIALDVDYVQKDNEIVLITN